MKVTPSGAHLGAEIEGVDLSRALDDGTFADIEAALDKHAVIVFRNQDISPSDQLRFSERFGALEINAFSKFALDGYPGILKVSNIKEDGHDIGYADAGTDWHSDMSYTATPPRATMLYALEVPFDNDKALGPTLFASAHAAYESLSDTRKSSLQGLMCTHRFSAKRRGVNKPVQLTQAQLDKYPDVVHPVVRTHPRTGAKALYVTDDECVGIEGMEDNPARELIAELAALIIEERFHYRHEWQVGDLLMWDNASVQHIAIRDYAWPQRRLMYRTTVNGSKPF